MEKWKLGVIGVLLLGLVGYGISQQGAEKPSNAVAALPLHATATLKGGKISPFVGQKLGGAKLPEWTQIGLWDNAKTPVSLDSLKGGPALIEFFSVDCSHCQEAAPFMEAIYRRYGPRGLKMVGIQTPLHPENSTGDEMQWPKVRNFVKAAGLTYPIGMDKNRDYFRQIGGETWPTTIIAAAGQIVHAETGYKAPQAISLAIELEKQLPGKGTHAQRAADLAEFLRPFTFGNAAPDATLYKSLTDDLEQRLRDKV